MTAPNGVSSILETALSDATLLLAWSHVHQKGGCPGTDGISTEDFAENAIQNLQSLARSVQEGGYTPDPLLRIWLERPGKSPRGLGIPTVRDRILQVALASVLSPIFEKYFEDCSYAYRPAHSLQMALSRIVEYRDQGYQWVVDADIQHFFDEISHQGLLLKIDAVLQDPRTTLLIGSWISAPIQDGTSLYIPERGIPQGSPISPLLANLYLGDLDKTLLAQGYRVVRYADDFIVLCKSRPEAVDALHLSEDVLNLLSLRIEPDKTRITSFEQGFRFLGADFIGDAIQSDTVNLDRVGERKSSDHSSSGGGLPDPSNDVCSVPQAPHSKQHDFPTEIELQEDFEASAFREPLRRTLYVIEQGAFIGIRNNRIVIRHDGKEIRAVPIHHVDQIVLQGNQLLSTALARACRLTNADIFLSTIPGNCDLKIDDLSGRQIALQIAQVDALQKPDRTLLAAKSIVMAKITNGREILRQFNLRRRNAEVDKKVSHLKSLREQASHVESPEALRGIEGAASRRYFDAITHFITPPWKWEGRTRRPPTDPINAVLSYGYGLLYQNILGSIRRSGLTPYLGVYHLPRPGHPALASDLIEEFRAPVVDRIMLSLFLEGKVNPEEFTYDEATGGGCRLQKTLRKKVIEEFEARMNRPFIHPFTRLKTDYRRAIEFQCERYIRFFRGIDDSYEAFRIR